jgi:hypothetical protein
MSFKQPPELHELQSDALGASLVDNPHLPASPIPSKNKALNTSKPYVTGAINELLQTIENIRNLVQTSLSQQQAVLGDFVSEPTLLSELQKIDTSVLKAIIKLSKEIEGDIDNPQDISAIAPSIKEAILKLSATNMAQPESAYEIWLALGNTGSREDFINSLKGERGTVGNDGEQGEPGQAAEITELTVTMLSPDAEPEVHTGGTPWARTFDLGIPRGEKGLTGDINIPPSSSEFEVINCEIADLQTVIDGLPRFLNKDFIINVNEGTVDEQLLIKNFCGYGRLVIKANNTVYNAVDECIYGTIESTTHNIRNLNIRRNSNAGMIFIGGFNFTGEGQNQDYNSGSNFEVNTSNDNIYFATVELTSNNTIVWIYYCNAMGGEKTNNTNIGFNIAWSLYLITDSCTISNKNYAQIASCGSKLISINTRGINNQVINSSMAGGIISLINPTITGTTKNNYSGGGLVINKSGGAIGTY